MTNCRCDLNLEIQEAKPKTADEIKAEYERLEDDLRTRHAYEMADLCRVYSERLEELCKQRGIELAEVVDPAVVKMHTGNLQEGAALSHEQFCQVKALRKQRAAALAEVENDDTHQQTTD